MRMSGTSSSGQLVAYGSPLADAVQLCAEENVEGMSDFVDAIIIGADPAGLTAARYSSRDGLHKVSVEKDVLRGIDQQGLVA